MRLLLQPLLAITSGYEEKEDFVFSTAYSYSLNGQSAFYNSQILGSNTIYKTPTWTNEQYFKILYQLTAPSDLTLQFNNRLTTNFVFGYVTPANSTPGLPIAISVDGNTSTWGGSLTPYAATGNFSGRIDEEYYCLCIDNVAGPNDVYFRMLTSTGNFKKSVDSQPGVFLDRTVKNEMFQGPFIISISFYGIF